MSSSKPKRPPPDVDRDRLVSVVEACSLGGISRATIYRLIKGRRIKAYRNNARTLIDIDSVRAWKNELLEL